jgi:hypothetical protein
MNNLLKCQKCGNDKKFAEVHVGGHRRHEWTQEDNGRFVFDGSNYDRVNDTFFYCGKCNADLSNQYRAFLRALCSVYDEGKHGV